MPPLAIARPVWAASLRSLRDLTRLAFTGLVLAIGLSGAAATPAGPAAATVSDRPAVVASRLDELRPRPAVERVADAPALPPRTPRLDAADPAVAPAPLTVAPTATDPVRDAPGRRGPPRV